MRQAAWRVPATVLYLEFITGFGGFHRSGSRSSPTARLDEAVLGGDRQDDEGERFVTMLQPFGAKQRDATHAVHGGLYRAMFDAIDDGFAIMELIFDDRGQPVDYRFLDCNSAFFRQTGIDDAIGRTARELVPDLEQVWFDVYGQVARTGQPIRFQHEAQPMKRWFDVQAFRLAEQPPGQIAILFRDVTQERQTQDRLRESQIRYRSALRVGRIGAWETDMSTRIRVWSDEGMQLFGIHLPDGIGHVGGEQDEWRRALHPDDSSLPEHVYEALCSTDRLQVRYRIRRPDGAVVSLFGNAEVASRAPDGTILKLINVVADVSELSEAEEALQRSESRLALALTAGQLGVHDFDPRTGSVLWDATVRQLWGVDPDEAITYETFARGVHPEDRLATEAALAEALDPAGSGRYLAEYRVISRKDGSVRWVLANGSVTFEQGVATRLIGTVRDITDRKHAEEHRQTLLQELNHRVKNTLATVKAIASQTLKGDGATPAAREAFDGRLMALASAHDALIQEDWTGAPLVDIIDRALAPHIDLGSARISRQGPAAELDAKTALALTMCLHELATNATKYGALSNDAGSVEITWRIEGEMLQLRWQEQDGPPVTPPERKGFGSRLIERVLGVDDKGSARMTFAPEGIICELTVPHGAHGFYAPGS